MALRFLVDLQQKGGNTAVAYVEHLFPSVETRWKERVNEHRNLSTPVQLEAFVETRELCVGLCPDIALPLSYAGRLGRY